MKAERTNPEFVSPAIMRSTRRELSSCQVLKQRLVNNREDPFSSPIEALFAHPLQDDSTFVASQSFSHPSKKVSEKGLALMFHSQKSMNTSFSLSAIENPEQKESHLSFFSLWEDVGKVLTPAENRNSLIYYCIIIIIIVLFYY